MFDPVQKTLLADQGEIRVGSKYQAEIPDKLAEGELEIRGKHMFLEFSCYLDGSAVSTCVKRKVEIKQKQ